MRVRILKKEFDISWEYLAALIFIILAIFIVLAYRMNADREEIIPVAAPPVASSLAPSEPAATDKPGEYYDVPDADDKETGIEQNGGSYAVMSVNVNNAGMDELISLPYIGEVKARAIIAYRTENGPFKSIEELLNVKGIGPKTLEKLRPCITLE